MRWLRWLLAFIAILKGHDIYPYNHALALGWFVAAASLAAHERYGCWTLACVTFGGAWLDLPRMTNHVVFFGWISLILALWGDRETRLTLLRIQLCAVYFFAGLSKINPVFLSGQFIAARLDWVPYPQLLAWAAIAMEWGLCVAGGLKWRLTFPLALLFHTTLVAMWTTDFSGHGPGILTFNLLIVAVVAVVVDPKPELRARLTKVSPDASAPDRLAEARAPSLED